jgi:DNA gyrase subunit B
VEEHNVRKRIEEETTKRKQQKAMNEQLTVKTKQFFVDKLVDASAKNDRHQCELLIVEGDSASQGLRTNRTSLTQGFYCLKGKSLGNTFYLQPQDILKKEVLVGLMKSLGLKFGQKATKQNLRYGRISILTDADVDGDQIAAMLALFFYKFWPELYTDGIIVRMITPILVCSKDNHKLYFYTDKEFSEHDEKLNAA